MGAPASRALAARAISPEGAVHAETDFAEDMMQRAGDPRYQSKFEHTKEPTCCTLETNKRVREAGRGLRDQPMVPEHGEMFRGSPGMFPQSIHRQEDPAGLSFIRSSAMHCIGDLIIFTT